MVSGENYVRREVAAILTAAALLSDVCWKKARVMKQIVLNADWKWVFGQKTFGSGSLPLKFCLQFPFCGFQSWSASCHVEILAKD